MKAVYQFSSLKNSWAHIRISKSLQESSFVASAKALISLLNVLGSDRLKHTGTQHGDNHVVKI
jgi:hypothetical protein